MRRKAAGTLSVHAEGRASHSGSAPDRGRNALLALAAAAQAVASCHDPTAPEHLTAVPTVLHAGDAFNVVPGAGELVSDMRADSSDAFQRVVDAIPEEVGGATLHTGMVRLWPGMDSTAATGALLERACGALRRPVVGMPRGGASDASHFAAAIPLTVDGLGPRGGAAHSPDEYIVTESLESRAAVALAVRARRSRSVSDRERLELARAQHHDQLAAATPTRTATTAPFLKSTRPPVRSCTTCENDGSWPTTSTRASPSWRPSSSSASPRSKPLAEQRPPPRARC